jgi:hypothetical protein
LPDVATDADLAAAARDAEEAQRRFLDLEHRALHDVPDARPLAADVLAAAKDAELAQRRVEVVRKRVEDAREDARLEAHHAIGERINQVAAEASAPSAEQVADLRLLGEVSARIRGRAEAHDATVRALWVEAALHHGDPRYDPVVRLGQPGTQVAHMPPQAVKYGNTSVHVVAHRAGEALAATIAGDTDTALKLLGGWADHAPPEPEYWLKDTLGQFPPEPVYPGQMSRTTALLVHEGRLAQMSQDEVEAWTMRFWRKEPGER